MSENPYEPPVDEDDGKKEPVGIPKYLGSLRYISGDIEKDEALKLANECKEVDVDPNIITQTAKSGGASWRTSLLIFGVLIAFMFLMSLGDDEQANQTAALSPEWVGTAMIVGWLLPAAWVGLFVFMMIRYRMKLEDSDPPFWGRCEIELSGDWYCVSKMTKDAVQMNVYCRWQDTYVKESENVWYLMAMDYCLTIIPKRWVDQMVERQVFNGFIYQVARYQHAKIHSTNEKDSEAESDDDDWLSEPDDDPKFHLDFTKERSKKDAKRLMRTIRSRFAEWNLQWQWPLSPSVWKYSGLVVCVAAGLFAIYGAWQSVGGSRWTAISILAPLIIVSFLSYLLGRLMKWQTGQSGWLTADRLRIDQKTSKIDLDLASYPNRELLLEHQAIVFSSESGKSVTWIRRESFKNDDAWKRACETLGFDEKQ